MSNLTLGKECKNQASCANVSPGVTQEHPFYLVKRGTLSYLYFGGLTSSYN
jgi:hypothetical protein